MFGHPHQSIADVLVTLGLGLPFELIGTLDQIGASCHVPVLNRLLSAQQDNRQHRRPVPERRLPNPCNVRDVMHKT
jgi:hypothetical protein